MRLAGHRLRELRVLRKTVPEAETAVRNLQGKSRSSTRGGRHRGWSVSARQALLIAQRRVPAQRLAQLAVLEMKRLEPRLEPARDQDAGHLGGAPEDCG